MAAPADSNDQPPVPSDRAFKAMYSHPRVVEDALRVVAGDPDSPIGPETLAALDFATLAKLPAEWVTEDFRVRHGDQAWRLRWRGGEEPAAGFLVVLLEFQSRPDPDMTLRLIAYALELHRDLEAQGVVTRRGPRPPVLPVVVHNGDSPWTPPARPARIALPTGRAGEQLASLQPRQAYCLLDFPARRREPLAPSSPVSLQIRFEYARTAREFEPPLRALLALADRTLARKMYAWVARLFRRRGVKPPRWRELEEMMLTEGSYFRSRLDRTLEEMQQQGIARGREQGMVQGREQGLGQGIAQGQRTLLERQATVQFGASVAERLMSRLADAPADMLADVGEWLLTASTGEELLARVDAAAPTEH